MIYELDEVDSFNFFATFLPENDIFARVESCLSLLITCGEYRCGFQKNYTYQIDKPDIDNTTNSTFHPNPFE